MDWPKLSVVALAWALGAVGVASCSNPERDRVKATTQANYDRATGKLTEITYDKNKNGKIDTWTKMDGSRPISSEMDTDEDGKIDRWEVYGTDGKLVRVMWERPKPPAAANRAMTGRPDAVAIIGPDGTSVERIEYAEVSELPEMNGKETIVRREFYQGGHLVRAEEDTLGRGLTGPKFHESDRVLAVLAVAMAFRAFANLLSTYLLAVGISRAEPVIRLVASVTGITTGLLLVPRFGILGAAWAAVGSSLVTIGAFAVVLRRLRPGPWHLWADVLLMAAALGAAALLREWRADNLVVTMAVKAVPCALAGGWVIWSFVRRGAGGMWTEETS